MRLQNNSSRGTDVHHQGREKDAHTEMGEENTQQQRHGSEEAHSGVTGVRVHLLPQTQVESLCSFSAFGHQADKTEIPPRKEMDKMGSRTVQPMEGGFQLGDRARRRPGHPATALCQLNMWRIWDH